MNTRPEYDGNGGEAKRTRKPNQLLVQFQRRPLWRPPKIQQQAPTAGPPRFLLIAHSFGQSRPRVNSKMSNSKKNNQFQQRFIDY